jgi:hypothetical protein
MSVNGYAIAMLIFLINLKLVGSKAGMIVPFSSSINAIASGTDLRISLPLGSCPNHWILLRSRPEWGQLPTPKGVGFPWFFFMIDLQALPVEHPLRNQPLGKIGAEMRNNLKNDWRSVATWKIAGKTLISWKVHGWIATNGER